MSNLLETLTPNQREIYADRMSRITDIDDPIGELAAQLTREANTGDQVEFMVGEIFMTTQEELDNNNEVDESTKNRLLAQLRRRIMSMTIAVEVFSAEDGNSTYGSQFPFFIAELSNLKEQGLIPEESNHLLLGYYTEHTDSEFRFNIAQLGGAKAFSLDLDADKVTSSGATTRASALHIPYRNGSMDSVHATNLLHMLVPEREDGEFDLEMTKFTPEERAEVLKAYFTEVSRVLSPGGHLLMTEYDLIQAFFGSNNMMKRQKKALAGVVNIAQEAGLSLAVEASNITQFDRRSVFELMGTDDESEYELQTREMKTIGLVFEKAQ